jgi:hypothetical protein
MKHTRPQFSFLLLFKKWIFELKMDILCLCLFSCFVGNSIICGPEIWLSAIY